jgi:hypothetical protein
MIIILTIINRGCVHNSADSHILQQLIVYHKTEIHSLYQPVLHLNKVHQLIEAEYQHPRQRLFLDKRYFELFSFLLKIKTNPFSILQQSPKSHMRIQFCEIYLQADLD